jgi:transketolase
VRNKFVELLDSETSNNAKIRLLTGDLGYGVLDNYSIKYRDNFINCGISEQSMIGIAGGLSSMGQKVFVYSIANFPSFRCLEQIRNDLVYMNNNVVIVSVGAGFSYGAQGYTHHGIEDISIMRCLGDIEIYTPADSTELEFIFPKLVQSLKTSYLRLGKGGETIVNSQKIVGMEWIRQINPAKKIVGLQKICIISCGPIAASLIDVAQKLQGLVNLDCFTVIKLDKDEVGEYFKNSDYDFIFTLEEHVVSGGFGSFINECLIKSSRKFQVVNLGIKNSKSNVFGDQEYLRKHHKIDSESVIQAISEIVIS